MAEFEPKIIAFVCNWCTYAGADLTGTSRIKYAPNVRIVRLPCTGRIDFMLLLQAFGLLVLDEPTTHQDIASREVLEEALRDYQGTLVFTSHDRRFMDAVATGVLELKDGRLTRYAGNWHDYRIQAARAAVPVMPSRELREPVPASTRDLDRERKREEAERRNRLYRILKPLRDRVQAVESEIDSLERTLREIEDRLTHPDLYSDLEQARKTGQEARQIRQRLDVLYAAWEEATEALGAAERQA